VQEIISENPEVKPRGRGVLLLLVLFFALPLVLVMLMYRYDWHPQGDSYGRLISPARAVQIPANLYSNNHVLMTHTLWHDKWSMVLLAQDCEQACSQRLLEMRQMHVSFAKDIDRVQRILIVIGKFDTALQTQYPDLIIISGHTDAHAAESAQALYQQFVANAKSDNSIYLVDPLGNLMMQFAPEIAANLIRKDIARLLRYAWAG
jgi:hypothetical protein